MKQKKVRKPSRDEIVATRIAAAIVAGAVLTVHAAYGYYTVGAYTPAVGPRGYAVYGYGGSVREPALPAREYVTSDAAMRAGWAVVSSCGSTRARDAVVAWERKADRLAKG